MAQMVKRSLPTRDVRSSNPVIAKIYVECLTVNHLEKTKVKNAKI